MAQKSEIFEPEIQERQHVKDQEPYRAVSVAYLTYSSSS